MFWGVIRRGYTFPENLNIVGGVPVILCEFPNFDMILTGVILCRRLSTTQLRDHYIIAPRRFLGAKEIDFVGFCYCGALETFVKQGIIPLIFWP